MNLQYSSNQRNFILISAVYLIIMLSMGVTSVLLTIYILKCHHSPEDKPVPNYLRKFCVIAKKDCCCKRRNVVEEADGKVSEDTKPRVPVSETELTWPEVTEILDKFFFKLYAVVLTLLTFAVLVTLVISYFTH